MKSTVLCAVLTSSIVFTTCAKLPKHFKRCSRNDNQFNICLADAVQDGIGKMAGGVPSLGLLPLEPLDIPYFSIDNGQGAVTLDMSFKNVKIYGISNVKILNQTSDFSKIRFDTVSLNKKLVFKSEYEVDGRILLLPIRGKGNATVILDNVKGLTVLEGPPIKKNSGKTYLDLKTFKFTFVPSRVFLNLENLFDGDKTLGPAMNRIINENWKELFKDLQPAFEEVLSEIFKSFASRVYQKVPLEELYPYSLP